MVNAVVFLSVAEDALCKATHTTTPPEYWGCHGIKEVHDDRWHVFKDCPHKHRGDVQTQFRKHAKEYKAFMESKCQTGMTGLYRPGLSVNMTQATTNWQELGFPSQR
jgi:hypothetical protein